MPRPIQALIHPAALRHNLARARAHAPDARLLAVVKADAYGHGIERVYPALRGADAFALLDLAEAERLRALGWRGPILLLEGAFEPRDLEAASRLGLWHVIHHEAQIDWLAAHKTDVPQRIFLKLNSGMNRLGFAPQALRGAWARLDALPQVEEISLMSHFADADADAEAEADPHAAGALPPRGIAAACARWLDATAGLPGERSLANSAALLRHGRRPLHQAAAAAGGPRPEAGDAADTLLAADWVRAGLMLYGGSPDHPRRSAADWDLRPAQTLRSRLIAVQDLQPGETVGYGSCYRAARAMRIGIAACGYADGYPRHAPAETEAGAPVLVDGLRTRTVGRVSMDMLAVDLEPLRAAGRPAGVGAEVTLWGEGPGGSRLPIDEVAEACGTVAYELMCALSPRVPVRCLDEDGADPG
ncbi:alanine racemase [Piscinibacter sp. Jin2]|uniref:Alanine racemase n=1 Tax=Aquariibacter lacus TaxID=2801332 RepID=A0A9X0XGS5_9BURK|nr:alanine racemase [Piscinibacter lacus]MBL0720803.1 alanine racemase [Piscinibacter lacus]